jgi:multidrug efflux pump subunit AcrB
LAILGAIGALSAIGQTLNIMTLGGLALAVGILVDEATVTIESINYHLEQGKEVQAAIIDGASQIVVPAFVSLLCICIVFIPMFFLSGVARYLFVPMAESVMFAMVFSFLLSRTLVPTMAKYLLRVHQAGGESTVSHNPLVRFQRGFEARFEQLRAGYHTLLAFAIENRRRFVAGFLGFVAVSFLLAPLLGRNFFPQVDGGQILLHVRAPVGMRIEETSARFSEVEQAIREQIPPAEVAAVVDNIGTYLSSINTIYNNTGTIGESDGDIQISLNQGHAPTADYVARLREQLPRRFPGMSFSFLPADIVSQILNFGAPAPIDLQIRGNNLPADYAYANRLLAQVRHVTGVADARIQQSAAQPAIDVNMDRTRAQYTGVTPADVTNSMVVNLASSRLLPTGSMRTTASLIRLPCRRRNTRSTRCRNFAICRSTPRGRLPPCSGASPTSVATTTMPWCRSTTSHPWWRSTPPRRGAIWGRFPGTSARSWRRTTRTGPRARLSLWSARRRP